MTFSCFITFLKIWHSEEVFHLKSFIVYVLQGHPEIIVLGCVNSAFGRCQAQRAALWVSLLYGLLMSCITVNINKVPKLQRMHPVNFSCIHSIRSLKRGKVPFLFSVSSPLSISSCYSSPLPSQPVEIHKHHHQLLKSTDQISMQEDRKWPLKC